MADVVQGRTKSSADVYRPPTIMTKVAAVACAALLALSLVQHSRGALWMAAVPFLYLLQGFQRLEVDGGRVRRVGLRAVELDLATARVVKPGRSWWVQLFFLGHCLELRDADGHGLLVEAWLWSATTRSALLDAVAAANPSPESPHS